MKLWIDDERPAPDGWYWAKDVMQAAWHVLYNYDHIEEISFDHDMGGLSTTVEVAHLIEKGAAEGTCDRIKWNVHSANPPGRDHLIAIMNSAERFWNKK